MRFYQLLFWFICSGFVSSAEATNLSFRIVPKPGVLEVIFSNIDSRKGVPDAWHCVTGTRSNWTRATHDSGRTFILDQMIGGCVRVMSNTERVTHHVYLPQRSERICLIPVFVDLNGRFIDWSFHPEGPTKHRARSGNEITALYVQADGNVRAATTVEAYGWDWRQQYDSAGFTKNATVF